MAQTTARFLSSRTKWEKGKNSRGEVKGDVGVSWPFTVQPERSGAGRRSAAPKEKKTKRGKRYEL